MEKFLNGVGKKMRNAYLNGKVTKSDIDLCYKRNVKEVEELSVIGWTISDLIMAERSTHNPLLRIRLQQLIEEHRQKSTRSNVQNNTSLKKLDYYTSSALGIGLRKVMKELQKIAMSGNIEARIVHLLMQAEFANLSAKKNCRIKKACYERKTAILMRLSELLYENDWKCGISYNTGKNSSYLIYIYLPDGVQLSWHCNDYNIVYLYDEIDCEWDGRECSTLEKLLEYTFTHFGIGLNFTEYDNAA